jgi:c-di-AMP phosphodiesterase-like protein
VVLETVEEMIVYLDLDNFEEIAEKQGWQSYKPNDITGSLTKLVTDFVRKYHGEVLFGLDEQRGTEECMIRLIGELYHDEIVKDLKEIVDTIKQLGKETKSEATLSIGVARGPFVPTKPIGPYQWSKRVLKGTAQRMARRALRKAKKQGGNRIIFL